MRHADVRRVVFVVILCQHALSKNTHTYTARAKEKDRRTDRQTGRQVDSQSVRRRARERAACERETIKAYVAIVWRVHREPAVGVLEHVVPVHKMLRALKHTAQTEPVRQGIGG